MIREIKIQYKDIYPKGQCVKIGNEEDRGIIADFEIYFYVDSDEDISKLKVGENIELDETFKIIEIIEGDLHTKHTLELYIKQYYKIEEKINDIIGDLNNFGDECNCKFCETFETIHKGEHIEVHKTCINCGGYVENVQ